MRPESDNTAEVMVPINDPSAPVIGENEIIKRTRRTLLVPVNPIDDEETEPAETPGTSTTGGRKE